MQHESCFLEQDSNSIVKERPYDNLMMLFSKQFRIRHFALVVVLVLQQQLPGPVYATQLGHEMIWNRGSLLMQELERGNLKLDSVFERKAPLNDGTEPDEYDRYAKMVKKWRIDVVAPGRRLTNLMKTVSTHTIANRLLADSDGSFAEVSRPMLKAYLGVELAKPEELEKWSAMRTVGNVGQACASLLDKRDDGFTKAFGPQSKQQEMLKDFEELKEQDGHHLAYLVFKNNLNLFMLESYLILCSRLDKVIESQPAFNSYTSLF